MTKIEWYKVTWYSKLLALVIFVVFPFVGFAWGIRYGEAIQAAAQVPQLLTSTPSQPFFAGAEYYANPAEWQAYQSTNGGFSIAYPIDFQTDEYYTATPSADWRVGANGATGNIFLTLTVPSAFEPQTNFADAKLTVGSSKNKIAIADCLIPDPSGPPATATSSAVINGIPFTIFQSSSAGAGNLYMTTSYRTIQGGQCYAVEYTVHSGQIANYPASYNLQPFSESQIDGLLDRIVGTFQFM